MAKTAKQNRKSRPKGQNRKPVRRLPESIIARKKAESVSQQAELSPSLMNSLMSSSTTSYGTINDTTDSPNSNGTILLSVSSKRSKKKTHGQKKRKFISPIEKQKRMKQAAKMSKKKRRKLIKLQEKKEADAKRLAIYKSLSETAISTEEQKLLLPSGNIGQLGSKRERVKRAFRLNKAGIPLTNEETEILLVRNDKVGSNSSNSFKEKSTICSVSKETIFDGKKRLDNIENFASQNESIKDQSITKEECKIIKAKTESEEDCKIRLAELKSKKEAAKKEALLLNRAKNIAIIKAQKKELHRVQNAPTTCVVHIDRNPEIQEQRLKLPVCGIEQEIIESVQNNDVIILCGATGSGKTTQTPQFLYEAGYSTAATKRGMIGVTQPRVCFI